MATAASRSAGSGRNHAPVDTPTPMSSPRAAFTAATAGLMAEPSRLSAPLASRGCMWIAEAPAATAAAAASASWAGVSGTAGWTDRFVAPLRQHFTNTGAT